MSLATRPGVGQSRSEVEHGTLEVSIPVAQEEGIEPSYTGSKALLRYQQRSPDWWWW